jgi:hypothetical protein
LGATLYKLLAGRAPFAGPQFDTTIKKLAALTGGAPQPIHEFRTDLPAKLAGIVHRLLATNPADRPATPATVVKLLAEFAAAADLSKLVQPHDKPPVEQELGHPAIRLAAPSAPTRVDWPRARSRWALIAGAVALSAIAIATVWLKPTGRSVAGASKTSSVLPPPATAAHNSPADVERSVAEWTLAAGGHVGLMLSNQRWVDVRPGETLPTSDFQIVVLSLEGRTVAPADLARLDGLAALTTLALGNSSVDDQSIAQIGNLPKLHQLYLSKTRIGDAAVQQIVNRYAAIDVLHIGRTQVTDRGVNALVALPNLQRLRLENKGVTDASVGLLMRLKELRMLWLQESKISADGVTRLFEALPDCRIESDHGNFGPPATVK